MTSDAGMQKSFSIGLPQTVSYFVVIGLVFGVVILLDNRLPTPLMLKDEVNVLM